MLTIYLSFTLLVGSVSVVFQRFGFSFLDHSAADWWKEGGREKVGHETVNIPAARCFGINPIHEN